MTNAPEYPTTTRPCCKAPKLLRETVVTYLKEPVTRLRLCGTRCRNCHALLVSPGELAENQRRAREVLRRVKVSASMFRDLFRDRAA